MGIKFGEIDSSQILENEFRIMVLERIVEFISRTQPGLSRGEVDRIREEVASELKKKYPNSIKLSKD